MVDIKTFIVLIREWNIKPTEEFEEEDFTGSLVVGLYESLINTNILLL